jgi:hypothetical protein
VFDPDGFIEDDPAEFRGRIDYSPCFPAFTGVVIEGSLRVTGNRAGIETGDLADPPTDPAVAR